MGLERMMQVSGQVAIVFERRLHRGCEYRHAAFPCSLCPIERHISIAEQLIWRDLFSCRHADTRPDHNGEPMSVYVEWGPKNIENPLRHDLCPYAQRSVLDEQNELIPTLATDGVAVA